jgi:hypothetical protein
MPHSDGKEPLKALFARALWTVARRSHPMVEFMFALPNFLLAMITFSLIPNHFEGYERRRRVALNGFLIFWFFALSPAMRRNSARTPFTAPTRGAKNSLGPCLAAFANSDRNVAFMQWAPWRARRLAGAELVDGTRSRGIGFNASYTGPT